MPETVPQSHRADQVLLRPVRAGNAFEEAVERLLQTIKLGVIGPGERLPSERDLAARLSISRMTLREAIRALQQAGYVECRRGRYGGSFITDPLPQPRHTHLRQLAKRMGSALDDALTFRQVVETGAAAAAAARDLIDGEKRYLQQRLSETDSAPLPTYRRTDSRLHLAIAELAGSVSLTSAVADVRMRVNELLDAIPLLERNIVHSNEQHATIVAAILAADPVAARAAMSEHLNGTAALLRGFLT
jgi:DNA-binding FadR family transcriptional regulator